MNIKRIILSIKESFNMIKEFYDDFRNYKKWNYNNYTLKTANAYSAKIFRQTHVLEKGLSLENPRKGFGVQRASELLDTLDEYNNLGFDLDSTSFQNAIAVILAYLDFQKSVGFEDIKLFERINDLKKYYKSSDLPAGIMRGSLDELNTEKAIDYKHFFMCRHSMRQFAHEKVKVDDINKAVTLAMKAPSACNRQATKVYVFTDEKTNLELSKIIAGNTGFENEVSNYLVLTGDMSAFYDSFERNQLYVEVGMFAMALMEAFHYYGIGSCPLQNGEYKQKNAEIKKICGNIPENERIVLFLAIGYYKSDFSYAVSRRKRLDEVLKFK